MMKPDTRLPLVHHFVNGLSWLLFNHRVVMLILFAVITVGLAWSSSRLRLDPGFSKMIPLQHPYMRTFTQYKDTFGGANRIVVALMRKHGNIYQPEFMHLLKSATSDVFFIPGVDRTTVQSLFTPNTRFIEITPQGFVGGNVVPSNFTGTPQQLLAVRANVEKAGLVGRLVAGDYDGALITASLLDADVQTGKKVDDLAVSEQLEKLREKYDRLGAKDGVTVHIIGFAKVVGDIADGLRGVIVFFGIAFVITWLLLQWYTKSTLLALVALLCALLPVAWLLGVLPLFGYGIDPFSILVPFLIFAIGVSHAVQMTNAWRQAAIDGETALEASRTAFGELFIPGVLALLTNALGFLVIMIVKIQIVQELAITASIGVTLMIVTNKMVLPIVLSYLPVHPEHLRRMTRDDSQSEKIWRYISGFATRRRASVAIAVALVLAGLGAWGAKDVKTGDLGTGVPELRANSRYNMDSRVITNNFRTGVDILSVIVHTQGIDGACADHRVMSAMDAFEWKMRNVRGVASALSLADAAKIGNAGFNEGNIKWQNIAHNRDVLAQSTSQIETSSGLLNSDCSDMQVLLFPGNHRGATLERIVTAVKDWNKMFTSSAKYAPVAKHMSFLLASGNAGIMAATNEAVDNADTLELVSLFSAIALMCLLTFRSLIAVACILIPLALVALLNNALMATLDIGLKISTLSVIALGIGVGVDYGIYIFERIQHYLDQGRVLQDAFLHALKERGAPAIFTATTMSVGVGTWIFSALKLQANMGLLLTFMFFINMLGAVFLLPSILAWLSGWKKTPNSDAA